jgi:hypothetical protein
VKRVRCSDSILMGTAFVRGRAHRQRVRRPIPPHPPSRHRSDSGAWIEGSTDLKAARANLAPEQRDHRPPTPMVFACRSAQTPLYVAAPDRPQRHRALRLAVQDAALSRRKHGFDSRRARHFGTRYRRRAPPILLRFSPNAAPTEALPGRSIPAKSGSNWLAR